MKPMMKRITHYAAAALLALALPWQAWAQQPDLEVTMEVVPANGGPDPVTGEIKLPDSASDQGKASSAFGLSVANKARAARGELGRDFGKAVSEAARERAPLPAAASKGGKP
jgi:hypothetical protein